MKQQTSRLAGDQRLARRRLSYGLGLTVLGCCALTIGPSVVHGDPSPPTAPVNAIVSPAGGTQPTLSGDGRFVAFVAAPSTPADGVTQSVWLRDQSNGALTELTKAGPGIRPGNSHFPKLSADGCTLVVETELGLDLFHDNDSAPRWDVYRKILPGCPGAYKDDEWELISSAATGSPSALDTVDPSQPPAVNRDGSVIAYARSSVDAGHKPIARTSIDVVDTTLPLGDPHRVTAAPGLPKADPTTSLTYVGQRDPSLSVDGSILGYTSDATFTIAPNADQATNIYDAIVPAWGTGPAQTGPATTQVFAWNRNPNSDSDAAFPLRMVSATPTGTPGSGSSSHPTLSADGRFVAYVSSALDIVSPVNGANPITLPDTTPAQIFRTDLKPPAGDPSQPLDPRAFVTTVVSRRGDTLASAPSWAPSIDASGQLVAFLSNATDLTDVIPSGQAANGADALEADLSTATVRRLTTHPDGSAATAAAFGVQLSRTGRIAAIETVAGGELVADPSTAVPGHQVAVVISDPVLSITPLDLGTNLIGTPTRAWITTVKNSGTSSFVPSTIALSVPSFVLTGGTCTPTVAVPPGGSCTVQLVFNPSAAGVQNAALSLKESGFAGTQVMTIISGSGGVPSIDASPTTNQLGTAIVGQQGDSTTITIGNLGTLASTIAKIELKGNNPGDFSIDVKKCLAKRLDIGGSCTLTASFKPAGNGERSALVVITATDTATTSIVLSANGRYQPSVLVPATSVYGGQSVGVGGIGFPANHRITIGVDTNSRTISVKTDAKGSFLTPFPFLTTDLPGQQHLTVVDTGAAFAPVISPAFVLEENSSDMSMSMGGIGN